MKPFRLPIALTRLVLLCMLIPATAAGDNTIVDDLVIDVPLTLCDEPVPTEAPGIVERYEKEMLVSLGNPQQVILYLKRSTRYFPFIQKSLAEKGMPDDLKYLAVAESALRMHAGSRKGAMGIWQLMPQTAQKYGLTVNGSFDERRNVYLSTSVALDYLKLLYDRFGSWSLTLAAYNMGEEGLDAEILEQGHSDYYRLYLPLETQRFVFRILAIKQIMDRPAHYGIHFTEADGYVPDTFATETIQALEAMPIRLIASAANTDFKAIKDLNPEIRGHYLAVGTRRVNIPEEGADGFSQRLATLVKADATMRRQKVYVVKKGDSLSGIADTFDIPLAALLIWNRLGIHDVIHPGQSLVIFPSAKTDRKAIVENGKEVDE